MSPAKSPIKLKCFSAPIMPTSNQSSLNSSFLSLNDLEVSERLQEYQHSQTPIFSPSVQQDDANCTEFKSKSASDGVLCEISVEQNDDDVHHGETPKRTVFAASCTDQAFEISNDVFSFDVHGKDSTRLTSSRSRRKPAAPIPGQ